MIEINKPTKTQYWTAYDGAGVVHQGRTEINQVTTTGQPNMDAFVDIENHLDSLTSHVDDIPILPDAGTSLSEGTVYNYNGSVVIVRQDHVRTLDDPATVPALFFFQGNNVDWIEQEQVVIGDQRIYAGTKYECIQSHVTQVTWEPPNVPALWIVVSDSVDWLPGVPVQVSDTKFYQGLEYICIQAHTTQVTWEPPNVPALWGLV